MTTSTASRTRPRATPRAIVQTEHLQRAYEALRVNPHLRLRPGETREYPPTLQAALEHWLHGPLIRILARSFALQDLDNKRRALRQALPHLTHDARGQAAHHHDD